MPSPYLTQLARTLEQAKLDQAADLAKRTLRADQLPPDLFINVHGGWDDLSFVPYRRADEAALDSVECGPYRITIQLLPDGTTRLLDLSWWGTAIFEENEQNARDDERHNRTLSSAAMGGR